MIGPFAPASDLPALVTRETKLSACNLYTQTVSTRSKARIPGLSSMVQPIALAPGATLG